MRSPWEGAAQERDSEETALFTGNGYFVIIRNPDGKLQRGLLQAVAEDAGLSTSQTDPHYTKTAEVMSTRTESVKWWKLPSQNRQAVDRILLKFDLLGATTKSAAIYTIHFGQMHGFQVGAPPGHVSLVLFDPKDREYRVEIHKTQEPNPFTQAELNALVASMDSDSP